MESTGGGLSGSLEHSSDKVKWTLRTSGVNTDLFAGSLHLQKVRWVVGSSGTSAHHRRRRALDQLTRRSQMTTGVAPPTPCMRGSGLWRTANRSHQDVPNLGWRIDLPVPANSARQTFARTLARILLPPF
jgi:hypothetical protein